MVLQVLWVQKVLVCRFLPPVLFHPVLLGVLQQRCDIAEMRESVVRVLDFMIHLELLHLEGFEVDFTRRESVVTPNP